MPSRTCSRSPVGGLLAAGPLVLLSAPVTGTVPRVGDCAALLLLLLAGMALALAARPTTTRPATTGPVAAGSASSHPGPARDRRAPVTPARHLAVLVLGLVVVGALTAPALRPTAAGGGPAVPLPAHVGH